MWVVEDALLGRLMFGGVGRRGVKNQAMGKTPNQQKVHTSFMANKLSAACRCRQERLHLLRKQRKQLLLYLKPPQLRLFY